MNIRCPHCSEMIDSDLVDEVPPDVVFLFDTMVEAHAFDSGISFVDYDDRYRTEIGTEDNGSVSLAVYDSEREPEDRSCTVINERRQDRRADDHAAILGRYRVGERKGG